MMNSIPFPIDARLISLRDSRLPKRAWGRSGFDRTYNRDWVAYRAVQSRKSCIHEIDAESNVIRVDFAARRAVAA